MQSAAPAPLVAIACGGTGGHLFPGLAVAEAVKSHGWDALLLISAKAVDQAAARTAQGMEVATLPGVGSDRGWLAFLRGFWQSYGVARRLFRQRRPAAVLAMGGFLSAPPVLAARRLGAAAFIHEANCIPGRANRWLAHFADEAFSYFPQAAERLAPARVQLSGMPVRSQFRPARPELCREALGLKPNKPVLLLTGGSQGARALNQLLADALPALTLFEPELQFIHLTGPEDAGSVHEAYARHQRRALVAPFLAEMHLALGAATVALSRAGASSLAEQAAMRVPSILVPYPAAADNHQYYNARAFVETGAAWMQEQRSATVESLVPELRALVRDQPVRQGLAAALSRWHEPRSAQLIARHMIASVAQRVGRPVAEDCAPEPAYAAAANIPLEAVPAETKP
jgi:UDP-N-acetylglucosamine--N-acetylmuramyl-(pentapeptide) pyrophosphoryl-undecaprenol N-acetylglucosamine transferase